MADDFGKGLYHDAGHGLHSTVEMEWINMIIIDSTPRKMYKV